MYCEICHNVLFRKYEQKTSRTLNVKYSGHGKFSFCELLFMALLIGHKLSKENSSTVFSKLRHLKMVKQSRYGPGMAQRAPGS